jgi:hypothetical protein
MYEGRGARRGRPSLRNQFEPSPVCTQVLTIRESGGRSLAENFLPPTRSKAYSAGSRQYRAPSRSSVNRYRYPSGPCRTSRILPRVSRRSISCRTTRRPSTSKRRRCRPAGAPTKRFPVRFGKVEAVQNAIPEGAIDGVQCSSGCSRPRFAVSPIFPPKHSSP